MPEVELFVWRGSENFEESFDYLDYEWSDVTRPDPQGEIESAARLARSMGHPYFGTACPYCGGTYTHVKEHVPNPVIFDGPWRHGDCYGCRPPKELTGPSMQVGSLNYVARRSFDCGSCGFWWESQRRIQRGASAYPDYPVVRVDLAYLKRMSINDRDVALHELGTHLRAHYKHIYELGWRRFEELVAEVYRNLGYEARLTTATCDDGFDILLFENNSSDQILVECKRFKHSRKVGLAIVDRLLGVQVRKGVSRAKLVTTSSFTRGASIAAAEAASSAVPLEIELVDASKLVAALDVYNTTLPPLEVLVGSGNFRGGTEWPIYEAPEPDMRPVKVFNIQPD